MDDKFFEIFHQNRILILKKIMLYIVKNYMKT